ncbi:MAG: hypothetical protein ABJC63_10275 [Gemmatimonadales bacterium]
MSDWLKFPDFYPRALKNYLSAPSIAETALRVRARPFMAVRSRPFAAHHLGRPSAV